MKKSCLCHLCNYTEHRCLTDKTTTLLHGRIMIQFSYVTHPISSASKGFILLSYRTYNHRYWYYLDNTQYFILSQLLANSNYFELFLLMIDEKKAHLTVWFPFCTATLHVPLAYATTLMSANSAWNTRERINEWI